MVEDVGDNPFEAFLSISFSGLFLIMYYGFSGISSACKLMRLGIFVLNRETHLLF